MPLQLPCCGHMGDTVRSSFPEETLPVSLASAAHTHRPGGSTEACRCPPGHVHPAHMKPPLATWRLFVCVRMRLGGAGGCRLTLWP